MPPLFSVIICTYQRYDFLPKAIESVQRKKLNDASFDIWVMDNSPDSDDRAAFAAQYNGVSGLHYVLLDTPGLSNARNEGVKRSEGHYVVFLDDDAEACSGWLEAYRDAFSKLDGKIGSIGGRIKPLFNAPRPSWIDDDLTGPYSLFNYSQQLAELPKESPPIGANVAFNRKAFDECGLFDTTLGRSGSMQAHLLSGEEAALFQKMAAADWRFFYTPFAAVLHNIPAERMTQAWVRRRVTWQGVTDQILKPLPPDQVVPLFVSIVNYINAIPNEHKPFMGLFWDTPDPAMFKKQLEAIYALNRLMLSTGAYPEGVQFKKTA